MLKRHERLSDLHRLNAERHDEGLQQRRDELRTAMHVLRHRAINADEQALLPGELQSRRILTEMQLRQLLFEYGQTQEMLEDSRGQKSKSTDRLGDRPGLKAKRPAVHEVRVGRLSVAASASSWQGSKDVQEDRHLLDIALESPEGLPVHGFCVLDGHSGSLCVDHLVERLTAHLQKCLSAKPSLTEEHLAQAVTEACAAADGEFLQRARQLEVLDGSTLILALLFPTPGAPGACRVLVANVGDSRAVLCRAAAAPRGEGGAERLLAVPLSEDHKPILPEEQRRIESKGGVVDLQGVWRVFTPGPATFGGRLIARWGLAVSRAFGDLLLKEPERYGCVGVAPGGLITAVPEIRIVDINPAEDRFLVLACDGVWDVLSDDDAVAVCSSQSGPEMAALALIRRSFSAGSDDNLTAVVITWRPADQAAGA